MVWIPTVIPKPAPVTTVSKKTAPVTSVTPKTAPIVRIDAASAEPLYADFLNTLGPIASKFDTLHVTGAPDEATLPINIVSPSTFPLTKVGNPTFEPFQGVTGTTNLTDYYDTGYIPGNGNYQLNDAMMHVFVCDNTFDPNNGSMHEYGNTFNLIKALETQLVTGAATTVGARVTRSATQRTASGVVTNAIGLVSAGRYTSGNLIRIYKDGVLVGGGGNVATGFAADASDTFKIGENSCRRIGLVGNSSLLTDAELATFNNACWALMTKLGTYDPDDLLAPPVTGGPDPYGPDASVVWTESSAGTSLNMTGLTLTHDSTFNGAPALATITPTGGAGPWFAPIHSRVGFAEFMPPNATVSPFSIQGSVLRIRMEQVSGVWQTGHMQTSDTNGAGFSQTMGYFEAKMKMPAQGSMGAWPAFWLYGKELYTNPSATRPEIDVMECYPGNDSRGHHASLHLRPGSPYVTGQVSRHWWKSDYTGMDAIRDGNWHTYGVELTDSFIIIYMDRVELERIPCPDECKVPLYLLVSLQGLDGELGQAVGPIDMLVEYVKVWQRA